MPFVTSTWCTQQLGDISTISDGSIATCWTQVGGGPKSEVTLIQRIHDGHDLIVQRRGKRSNLFGEIEPLRRLCHEEVSKPFEDSEQARQVKEALEQVGVVFPARDEPAEIVEPADTAFDPVAANIASQRATVLARGLGAVRSMGTDQLDATHCETVTKPIGVGRSVVQQTESLLAQPRFIEECFDRVDFAAVGGRRVG